MRLFLISIIGLVCGGCTTAGPVEAPQERPVLLQYAPGQNGGVRLTTVYGGVLTRRGPCLGLLNGTLFTTMIWPETARLSFDRHGLVLRDLASGAAVRLGDWVEISGGPLPSGTVHDLGSPTLVRDFPIECARRPTGLQDAWIGVANPGFRKRTARRL